MIKNEKLICMVFIFYDHELLKCSKDGTIADYIPSPALLPLSAFVKPCICV